jgi:hypothetical protein
MQPEVGWDIECRESFHGNNAALEQSVAGLEMFDRCIDEGVENRRGPGRRIEIT